MLKQVADSDAGQPGVDLISGRPRFTNPASDVCFLVARGFLDECLQNHPLCRADFASLPTSASHEGTGDDRFPTRTIDVGPTDGSGEPSLSVHSTGEAPLQWVTLSHCWSGHSPQMTTLSNYEEMKRAIPVATLPPLFQDAVTITRKLNLRHLWIDSLCIIQDSPKDKAREITKMGSIYRNAMLSIAADACDNCFQRILRPRDPEFVSVKIPFKSSKRCVSGNLFIRPALSNWDSRMIWESRLSERAWVLQESLLARRTLHYCEQEMLWECRVQCTAESNLVPVNASRSMNWSSDRQFVYKSFLFPPQALIAANNGTARETMYKRYYSIIENYTSRKLSKPEDRLPAFAGLASWFQVQLDDTYQAGLFANDLLRGLFWETKDRSTAVYLTSYRAPSWSWASIEAPMKFTFLRMGGLAHTCHAEVLDIETDPWSKERTPTRVMDRIMQNQDQVPSSEEISSPPNSLAPTTRTAQMKHSPSNFGQLASGLLTLRGPWRDAQAWRVSKPEDTALCLLNPNTDDDDNERMYCKFDVATPATTSQRSRHRENFGFLHVSSDGIPTREEGSVWALILERTARGEEYRRIGIGFMSVKKVAGTTEGWETRTVCVV